MYHVSKPHLLEIFKHYLGTNKGNIPWNYYWLTATRVIKYHKDQMDKLSSYEEGEEIDFENSSSIPLKFVCITVATAEGETLTLSKVTRSEMGTYLCIASNGVPPSVSKRMMLHVHCKWALISFHRLFSKGSNSKIILIDSNHDFN